MSGQIGERFFYPFQDFRLDWKGQEEVTIGMGIEIERESD